MNRLRMSLLALVAVAFGALPAQAITISYTTAGSNADVAVTPTSSGDIAAPVSNFTMTESLFFIDTSNGHYGQSYTFIPFTVSGPTTLTATVNDLKLSDPGAKALEWLSIGLYEYTGGGFSYLTCGKPGSLCTLEAYDADPPTVSISSVLAAGTQYLLRIGFGLCGCSGDYGGITMTVATTPVPPALLLFLTGLGGFAGMALRRRSIAAAV
jgi:hypothetical protein